MKWRIVAFMIILTVSGNTCSLEKKKNGFLACIDIRKNYTEKEIIITDFADVTYIHLSTDCDDYLYKGRIENVTNNTLVVYDNSSFSILFFTKDGTPKSRFNRCGQGPEEYFGATRILYDEELDDVFVCNDIINYIQVYSSTGEYKRKITLPEYAKVSSLVSFDNQSFFVFSEDFHDFLNIRYYKHDFPYTTYYRISKTNGEILDSLKLACNEIRLDIETKDKEGKTAFWRLLYYRLVKGTDGFFLCNPETDTVFLYKRDKSLTPVFYKIPSLRNQVPKVIIPNIVDASRYQFFEVATLVNDDYNNQKRFHFRDKETGEIFRQKIISPDYIGKEFFICASGLRCGLGEKNGYVFELGLFELKQAYNENRLDGKLKELVATLDEYKDNNVFMFVEFK